MNYAGFRSLSIHAAHVGSSGSGRRNIKAGIVILINGKIVVDGGPEIIKRVDTEGYEWIKNELGIEIAKEINAPMNEVSIGVCATREAVKNEK